MSIFGKIMSSVFGKANATEAAPSTPSAAPASGGKPAGDKSAPSSAAGAATGSGAQVDVSAILNKLAAENSEKLDWRGSIVDLMKLLDLDSSFSARK